MIKKIMAAILVASLPSIAYACACGCEVFNILTQSNFPTKTGTKLSFGYDYLNQDQHWQGTTKASDTLVLDSVTSQFVSATLETTLDRNWTLQIEIPYWSRTVKEAAHVVGVHGSPGHSHNSASTKTSSGLGDAKFEGIYTGLSEDMSLGLTFGIKLPTGQFRDVGERDTQIGSGSTDILFGGYKLGNISSEWTWFAQAQACLPVLIQEEYTPGTEYNAALGTQYKGWTLSQVQVKPTLQLIATMKQHDSGENSDTENTGYRRLAVSTGLSAKFEQWELISDIAWPVYQFVYGDQRVAPHLIKFRLGYAF